MKKSDEVAVVHLADKPFTSNEAFIKKLIDNGPSLGDKLRFSRLPDNLW